MKRQNRTLIILAIWALVFVNIAFLIALRAKPEAAGKPEVYRVSEAVASETTEPEATEVAHQPDFPEQEEATEDCSADEPLEDSDADGASTIAFPAFSPPHPSASAYGVRCHRSGCNIGSVIARGSALANRRVAAQPGGLPASATGGGRPPGPPEGEGFGGETESIDGAAPVFPYTEQDVHDLAVAVYLEAGNASERAKLLVANVVINHVASREFPDTIHGVLTVPYHYGTMAWDGVEFPADADPALVEDCLQIARRILDGERLCPANVIGQAEFIQGRDIFEYIDGIYFCYS